MLCINKNVETASGAVAHTWVPILLTVPEEGPCRLSLTGRVSDKSPVAVDVLEIDVDIAKVHGYKNLIEKVEKELTRGDTSFLRNGDGFVKIPGIPGEFRKKPVDAGGGVIAQLWKRLDFNLDFEVEAGVARYAGYRDKDAILAGKAPVPGARSKAVVTARMLCGPAFRQPQKKLLEYITHLRGCRLYGGSVGTIDE